MKEVLRDRVTVGLKMTKREFDLLDPSCKRTRSSGQEVLFLQSGVPAGTKPVFLPVTIKG